uniref:Uncharacterized protein n=1 Tax=Anopheles christyi TaxID=43041 RepID=A0A182K8V9_9DIPT
MGRRKWKHYQDVLTRQQLNLLDPSTTNSTEDDLLTGATGVATAAVAAAAAAAAAQLQQGQLMSSASATAAATALSLAGGGMIDQKTSPAAIVAAANAAAVASLTTPAAAQAAANTTAATAIDTSSIKSEQPNPEVAIVPKLPIVGTNNNIINSNNNTIQHRSNGMAIKDGSSGTKPLAAETPAEPEAETPVDWKPQDKCYFCVDGKLLTVNETGELVPENGPGPTEGERFLNRRAAAAAAALAESDSDTSESSEPELLASLLSAGAAGGMSAKSLVALLREAGVSQNLPSLQPFVAQYTAAASLQGLQPNITQLYNPALWYSQLQQQLSPTTVETAAGGAAATVTLSPTTAVKMAAQLGTVGGTGEQPLDLSAKPGTSGMTSLLSSMMDPKHMYK